ncbi:xanthine dehydrogenase family protein subunit M [Castellaniella sp.]|uniref:FAD binding domain-containing protein n=1 Tax=Castellaniella sp. TaxID=1955812 RepID=UPI003569D6A6
MKPAAFEYFRPDTVDEVLELLERHEMDAKIIAGGQTLGPLLNMRLAVPGVLVDINHVAELGYRRTQPDGGLAIGALTRQSTLEDDTSLKASQPLVHEAIPHIAHRAIRNRGTVAGSLSHADPAAEWTGLVTALDADLVLKGPRSAERVLKPADFFQGILTTAIEPVELLAEIRLPAWPDGAGWSFMEVNRRHGDFALAGVLVRLGVDAAGRMQDPRMALIGMSDRPVRALEAEQVLRGAQPEDACFSEAVDVMCRHLDPMDDLHASAGYRLQAASTLMRRALNQARSRIGTNA